MYAVGYFLEVGVGTEVDLQECVLYFLSNFSDGLIPSVRALQWYKRAADQGDKRSMQRLRNSNKGPIEAPGGAPNSVLHRDGPGSDAGSGKGGKDKDCVIM